MSIHDTVGEEGDILLPLSEKEAESLALFLLKARDSLNTKYESQARALTVTLLERLLKQLQSKKRGEEDA